MENVEIITQLIELKKQISYLSAEIKSLHVSFWEKSMPTIVGALVGGGITFAVNLLNIKKDNKKYKQSLLKEKNDLVRKLYSDANSTLMLLSNTILSLNHHNLLRYYYSKRMEKVDEHQKQNLESYNKEDEYYLSTDLKVRELLSKISGTITEYNYIAPESKITENIATFLKKDLIRVKKENIDINKNIKDARKELQEIMNEAKEEIEAEITKYLTPILKEMKEFQNTLNHKK